MNKIYKFENEEHKNTHLMQIHHSMPNRKCHITFIEFLKTFSAYNCSNNDYQQSLFTQALRILCRFMPCNSGIIPHTLHCANTRLLTDVYVVHGVIPLKICHLWLKFCINIVSLSFKLKNNNEFCTCHASSTVMTCGKFCSDLLEKNWIITKYNFHHIWILHQ